MMFVRSVVKLLRARWWIALNNLRRTKRRTRFGYIFFFLFLIGVIAGAFGLSWAMLSLLRTPLPSEVGLGTDDLTAMVENIPVVMLSGAFVMTFLLSFQVLLQALYLSGDMDFLLSTPIPAAAVFVAKWLEAILPSFLLFSALTMPLLWGLGAAYEYHFLYYPLALVMLALQTLAAAGLSALLVMAIVRVFPARRVFEVLSFLAGMLGLLCSQWYNLRHAILGGEESAPVVDPRALFGRLSWASRPWSPLAWPGLGLTALARGEWAGAVLYLTLGVGLSAGLFLLSLGAAQRLYYSGWAKVRATPGRRLRRAARQPAETQRIAARGLFLPPPVAGVLTKDLRLLRRDLRNLSQLISPVILAVVYAAMMLTHKDAPVSSSPSFVSLNQLAFYGAVFISLVSSGGLTMRLAMMGFSQEGRCYWILKSAPIRPGHLALAKWLAAFLPSAGIGSLLVVGFGVAQGINGGDILYGLLTVLAIVAGNTGLNLAFGITGARLDWADPRRMISGGAGCLSSLLSMILQGLALVLFLAIPPMIQELSGSRLIGWLVGLALGGTLSAVMAVLPPLLFLKRIPRIGEEGD